MTEPGAATPSLPVLVFDGDCAFCSATVRRAQRWIRRMPPVVPFQRADLGLLGLTEADCLAAVQYVARDRKVYAAEDAVGAVLLAAGKGWWLLGAVLRAPGIHWLSGVVYRSVARNRHRLPGSTPACSLADR